MRLAVNCVAIARRCGKLNGVAGREVFAAHETFVPLVGLSCQWFSV